MGDRGSFASLEALVADEPNVPGLSAAVLGEDGEVAAAGFGLLAADGRRPVGTASMFHAASMSKLVTAVVALRLVARGLLDLDADIAGRTGGWTLPRTHADATVSLRMLLSHHGGIEDDADAFGPLRAGQASPSLEEVLRGQHPLVPRPVRAARTPGAAFAYSDAGYCVVEQVLATSTRTPFAELARELVLEPLGMGRSAFGVPPRGDADVADGHDASGAVIPARRPDYPYPAAAGLWSTPSDLALLVRELGLALRGAGALGIPSALAAAQLRPQLGTPWAGLGVLLGGAPERPRAVSLGWGEGFQCMLRGVPHEGRAVVVMTNVDPGAPQEASITGRAVEMLDADLERSAG